MSELLLGIDVGTTAAKAVLATPEGAVVSSAACPYPTAHLRPGWVEQDPSDWWAAVATAVRAALDGLDPGRVAGVGVSGQGCAVTLVDGEGEVVRPAVIWMDSRAEAECEELRRTSGERIVALSGKPPAPYNADPVLMWLAKHEPDSIRRARLSLTTTGYVTFRLCGEAVANRSDASILLAYDLALQDWSVELIEAFGLPRRLYPPVRACQEVVGYLATEAAVDLGLPPGVPVVAGGEDTSSAALAAGVTGAGQGFLSLGAAGTVYVALEAPRVHPRLLTFQHVLERRWLLGGSTVAFGAALDWGRRLLGGELGPLDFAELAARARRGADGLIFLPYLSGELQPINDGHARGALIGLSLSHGRPEVARAVLEGSAFALAHNLEFARNLGLEPRDLRATGGPTRSPLWCQIIADVTGCILEVVSADRGASLGTALLAGAGVGLISDPAGKAHEAARVERGFVPDAERRARYAELFGVYRELYPRLRPAFAPLAAMQAAPGEGGSSIS